MFVEGSAETSVGVADLTGRANQRCPQQAPARAATRSAGVLRDDDGALERVHDPTWMLAFLVLLLKRLGTRSNKQSSTRTVLIENLTLKNQAKLSSQHQNIRYPVLLHIGTTNHYIDMVIIIYERKINIVMTVRQSQLITSRVKALGLVLKTGVGA